MSASDRIYAYPLHDAARVAVATVRTFLESDEPLERVVLTCLGSDVFHAYDQALAAWT